MPRIRTIKPEFWRNEDLSAISAEAALLAIGLLNYCDDEGYFNANPKLIESDVFPLRELSGSCPVLIDELHRIGYLAMFSGSDGKKYGQIVNFEKHQVINKKNISRIKELIDLPDDYGSDTVGVRVGKERKGKEQGKERKGREVAQSACNRPEGVLESLWDDFLILRKAKRAPLTNSALEGIEQEAKKAGMNLEEALYECCARGWTGFKAEWIKKEPFDVGSATRKILERELEKEARLINPWEEIQ